MTKAVTPLTGRGAEYAAEDPRELLAGAEPHVCRDGRDGQIAAGQQPTSGLDPTLQQVPVRRDAELHGKQASEVSRCQAHSFGQLVDGPLPRAVAAHQQACLLDSRMHRERAVRAVDGQDPGQLQHQPVDGQTEAQRRLASPGSELLDQLLERIGQRLRVRMVYRGR